MTGLRVSPSPHRSGGLSTQKIMLMVIIALLPSAIMGCIYFGFKAALVLVETIVYCVAFEALFAAVTKKQHTISDLSAVVTGLLLGMNLPSTVPFYVPLIGSFFAIVIVKQLFGGIGQNFANPAIAARIVLMVSFSSQMTSWVKPFDTVTGATPLAAEWLDNGEALVTPFTFNEMLFGQTGGCIGETCALALIIGGIFLIVTGVISPATPIAFIGVFGLLTFIYTGSFTVTIYQILAGGLMIGAFFMATDYATTPLTTKGKIVFGTGCAIITFVIRQFGSFPEGVSFSILLMNLLTPYIDRLCRTKPLGAKITKKTAKEAE